jgi:hypothetical protein
MAVRISKINIHPVNILAATIVLANVFSRLVDIPSRGFLVTFLNIQWALEIDGRLLFMLLLALLVVIGAETIFRSHPLLSETGSTELRHSTVIHWILPGLAAFGGSTAVSLFPESSRWWIGLVLVSGLLILSVLGEYIVIDRRDTRYDLAALGLNVLGLTLLAILFSAIHAGSARLAFALPVIVLMTFVIVLRLLDLSSPPVTRKFLYALGISVIVVEMAFPLLFMPIASISFGLVLSLSVHTLVGFANSNLGKGIPLPTIVEYLILDVMAVAIILILVGR